MGLENHFNSHAYDNWYENLKKLYEEQVPSCIFMFLTGVSATLTMLLLGNTVAGKSASIFLVSLTSGLSQLKIFLAVAILLLLTSSFSKFSQNFSENESIVAKTGLLANMSNKGLFSFLVPYAALTFGIGLVMFICFKEVPNLFNSLKSQGITIADVTMLFFCSFIIILFSTMFYLASLLENIAKSRMATISVTFVYFIMFLIALFDIAK